MTLPTWWSPPWIEGSVQDPDCEFNEPGGADRSPAAGWQMTARPEELSDDAILRPLEEQFADQTRSRDRVRDLAEVFTHQREVTAILNQIPDAFGALDVRFLEPACGSGNFLTEILRRKLDLVHKDSCSSQEQYEHRLLRASASIYGIDISHDNVAEARSRMAHILLEHFQADANTVEPSAGFLNAAAIVLGDNIVAGDTLNGAADIVLCEWQPHPGGRFTRVWSPALVPEAERDLFWVEERQDDEPIHYADLTAAGPRRMPRGRI